MLRVGVVGVGNMGYHHARIYSELSKGKRVEFAGVVDINLRRAREVAKQFNTKAFGNPKELIKEGVDAVSIAVPTSKHRDVALEFITQGIDVLVEKPIADNLKAAMDIITAAEKEDVVLMVGHVERFNPAVLKLKEIIEDGFLGDVVTMSAKRVGPMVLRISDVGVVVDLAVHDIDVMRFITNADVLEVYAKVRNAKHPANVEDCALIMLSFENSISGIIETNRLTPHKVRVLNVVGTRGIAHVDYLNQKLLIYDEEWVREAKIDKKEPLRNELEHFLNCIEKRKRPLVDGEEGLAALKIAIKALKSAKENRIIRIDEP